MLGSLMSVVQKERDHIRAVTRRHKNQLVPAVRLPPELLESIFGFLCFKEEPVGRDHLQHWTMSRLLIRKRNTLRATCSRWKAVVDRQSVLWSRLDIRRLGHLPSGGHDLLMASERSRIYGLSITTLAVDVRSLKSDIDMSLFNNIIDEVSQTCETLIYHYPSNQPTSHILHHSFTHPFSRLRNLFIYNEFSQGSILELPLAPQLRTLSIAHRDGPEARTAGQRSWIPKVIIPPATSQNLKHLSIQTPLSNLDELLRNCAELRTLRIDCPFPEFLAPELPVRLPYLEHLCIETRDGSREVPLALFDCPQLECYHVSTFNLGLRPQETLSPALAPYFPRLRVLSLNARNGLTGGTLSFLQNHSTIEQLHLLLFSDAMITSLVEQLRASTSPSFLPSLEVIKFHPRGVKQVTSLLDARPGPDGDPSTGAGADAGGGLGGPPLVRLSAGTTKGLPQQYADRVRRDRNVDWSWNTLWTKCNFDFQ